MSEGVPLRSVSRAARPRGDGDRPRILDTSAVASAASSEGDDGAPWRLTGMSVVRERLGRGVAVEAARPDDGAPAHTVGLSLGRGDVVPPASAASPQDA